MTAKLIVLKLKPRNLEQALSLVIENGVTTLEEKRVGRDVQLHLQIPSHLRPNILIKKLRAGEKKLPKPIFLGILCKILKDESWKKAYQSFLTPFVFPAFPPEAPPLWIKPVGPYPKKPQMNTLIIHGQLAFGTGHHPSTQLAGYLMQKVFVQRPASSLLDLGCGTGILAMVAHRRGLRNITAVENDPEARRVARNNLHGNKIRGISLRAELSRVRKRHPLIVANIIAQTHLDLKDDLKRRLTYNGSLILSGLNYRDVPGILRAYRGFCLVERRNKKGWCALWLERTADLRPKKKR